MQNRSIPIFGRPNFGRLSWRPIGVEPGDGGSVIIAGETDPGF